MPSIFGLIDETLQMLKALLRTNVLNDSCTVFSIFFKLPAVKKHQKRCSCDVIGDIRT